jgi:hypothetical protein
VNAPSWQKKGGRKKVLSLAFRSTLVFPPAIAFHKHLVRMNFENNGWQKKEVEKMEERRSGWQ